MGQNGRKRLPAPSGSNSKASTISKLEEKARVVALKTAANLNKPPKKKKKAV